MLEVLTGTIVGAPVYQLYGEILAERRFRPAGFTDAFSDSGGAAFGQTWPWLVCAHLGHLHGAPDFPKADVLGWEAYGRLGRIAELGRLHGNSRNAR